MNASYSILTLWFSIVESQLHQFAEFLGRRQKSPVLVDDFAGKGLDRLALYIQRVFTIEIRQDRAWPSLKDLQEIRNVIVHSGGRFKESNRSITNLIARYPGDILDNHPSKQRFRLWIGMSLCQKFASDIEQFFERLFQAADLPDRQGQKRMGQN